MNSPDRPNLFSYATSELSQDAFICWLAKWADPIYKDVDPALHQAGQEFIVSMVHKVKPEFTSDAIETVGVDPQFQKLDILIILNGDTPQKLAILVEDKTHTSNHSGQLSRYLNSVKAAGYSQDQMVPLYFKTGYQSKFDTIGEFKTYLRHDFLAVLQHGKQQGVANAIYDDFLAHLHRIDALIKQFSTKLTNWSNEDWIGFYMHLYSNRNKLYSLVSTDMTDWAYVPNEAGGFVGFWWYFRQINGEKYNIYLQLERDNLCFKIGEISQESNRSNIREVTHFKLMEMATRFGDFVERPKQMGSGKTMTIAHWKGKYIVFNEDQLDFDATIANLVKAQEILDAAFPVA